MPEEMNISRFKRAVDGTMRPNRYLVEGEIPGHGPVPSLIVKAASYPASSIGIISLPYRGRVAKMPGDRVYPEWTFSIYDTQTTGDSNGAGDVRSAFEEWNRILNDHTSNLAEVTNFGLVEGNNASFPDWTVTLLDTKGIEVRTIRLKSCWPVDVGAIDLTYDAADTITEYSVTLAYDYIEVGASRGDVNGS